MESRTHCRVDLCSTQCHITPNRCNEADNFDHTCFESFDGATLKSTARCYVDSASCGTAASHLTSVNLNRTCPDVRITRSLPKPVGHTSGALPLWAEIAKVELSATVGVLVNRPADRIQVDFIRSSVFVRILTGLVTLLFAFAFCRAYNFAIKHQSQAIDVYGGRRSRFDSHTGPRSLLAY